MQLIIPETVRLGLKIVGVGALWRGKRGIDGYDLVGVTRTEDAEDREIGNVLIWMVYGWVAMSGVGA